MGSPNAKFKLKRAMEMLSRLVSSQTPFSKFETPNHPPYSLMISRAIMELNEGSGSSYEEISEFIGREYDVQPVAHGLFLRHYLMKLCERREIKCVDDGVYILPVETMEPKKRKRRRRLGKRVRARSKLKTVVEDIKEGRETEEQEITNEEIDEQKKREEEEENVDKGKEENTEIDEEQSKLERQEVVVVSDVENERTSLVVTDGEILQQITEEENEEGERLDKEDTVAEGKQNEVTEEQQPQVLVEKTVLQFTEESENLNNECNEGETEEKYNEAVDEQLGISLEHSEVVVEEITHQFANDESNEEHNESEGKQYEVIEEKHGRRSRRIELKSPQADVVLESCQLAEVQNQQEQQLDKGSKLSYETTSASALNEEQIEHREGVIEEQQPEVSFEQNDAQTQLTEVSEKPFSSGEVKKQQRQYKIRFTFKGRSASSQTDISHPNDLSCNSQQIDLEQLSELPIVKVFPGLKSAKKKLSHISKQEHDQCQVQKRQRRSHNRPNTPKLVTETTILEQPMLSQHQDELMQQAQLQGQEKKYQKQYKRRREMKLDLEQNEPSVSKPAALAMTLWSPPSEHQHEQQPQVLGKRARPTKPKTEVKEQSPTRPGRRRPPKPKTEVKEQSPKRPGRGRRPKPKTDEDTTMEVQHQREQHHLPAPGRGRPMKAKHELKLKDLLEQKTRLQRRVRPLKLK